MRRALEGGRRRAARRQHPRVLDRDLIVTLARFVEQGGDDARRAGDAVRAVAGEQATTGLGLGEQALDQCVVRFAAAGGLPPGDPAPLIGEQRLLLIGRELRPKGGVGVCHPLIAGRQFGVVADRLLGLRLGLPALGHRLRRRAGR
jgi:hypothetical protein